jgi:hypothetical protein
MSWQNSAPSKAGAGCNNRSRIGEPQETDMSDLPDHLHHQSELDRYNGLKNMLAGAAVAAVLAGAAPPTLAAADCPPPREPRIPASEEPALNIDKHKKQLLAYQAGTYSDDVALVTGDAGTYVERRSAEVKSPAVVLDIDETSLSNWANIQANNFGFIKGGSCTEQPGMACGFDEWITKGIAPPIRPTLTFFKAVRAKNVAVFFITGRRTSQREPTILNLDRAGYEGWARLATRPENDTNRSVTPFKSGERAKIETAGYTIVANIGDQDSDIAGGFAECVFKLPNPFYFID